MTSQHYTPIGLSLSYSQLMNGIIMENEWLFKELNLLTYNNNVHIRDGILTTVKFSSRIAGLMLLKITLLLAYVYLLLYTTYQKRGSINNNTKLDRDQ